jgi:hypothetical protein
MCSDGDARDEWGRKTYKSDKRGSADSCSSQRASITDTSSTSSLSQDIAGPSQRLPPALVVSETGEVSMEAAAAAGRGGEPSEHQAGVQAGGGGQGGARAPQQEARRLAVGADGRGVTSGGCIGADGRPMTSAGSIHIRDSLQEGVKGGLSTARQQPTRDWAGKTAGANHGPYTAPDERMLTYAHVC